MNQIDLKNRVAVITGGARGIGLATAERFARSGAKPALWDRDGAEAAARRIEGAIGCTVDVSDEKSVAAALAETERRLGPGRHPGRQRGDHRAQHYRRAISRRCVAPGDRYRLDRRLPVLPRGDAGHGKAQLRAHRQHRLGRRQGGQSQRRRLLRRQGRRHRAHQVARQGAGADRRSASTASRRRRSRPTCSRR